jgi:hypothetical protein
MRAYAFTYFKKNIPDFKFRMKGFFLMSIHFKILIIRQVGNCIRHVAACTILWHCSIMEKFVCQCVISAVPSGNGNSSDDNITGDVSEGQMKTHSFRDK